MRRHAFCFAIVVAVSFLFARAAETSPLVTLGAAAGHDATGRVIYHDAAFHNDLRLSGVWSLDASVPLAAAAFGSLRTPELIFRTDLSLLQVPGGRTNPGQATSTTQLAAAPTSGAGPDSAPGLEVREEQLTSLLEEGQGNADGLSQALSVPPEELLGNGPPVNLPRPNVPFLPLPNGPGLPPIFEENTPAQVAEPGSMVMFGLGVAALFARGRRRLVTLPSA